MAVTIRGGAAARLLTRRRFLTTAASSAAITIAGGIAKPSSQPRGRPAVDHARHPVGRRVDRFRRGLGARRPAGAHAGRGRDHRQLQDHPQRGLRRRACRKAISPPRSLLEGSAGGPGHLLPRPVRGHWRRRPLSSEPQVGRFRTAPSERRSVSFVWSGDTAGQGWGIDEARGGMRTYATMLRQPAGLLHPFRRQHLCRLPDRAQR